MRFESTFDYRPPTRTFPIVRWGERKWAKSGAKAWVGYFFPSGMDSFRTLVRS